MAVKIAAGYRVGKLTVTGPTEDRKNGYMVWECRCDCGGMIRLDTRYLQRGTITDCGCTSKIKPRQADIAGQRFGKLVAIKPTANRAKTGSVMWLCKCDCGKTIEASAGQLRAGYRRSCGCLTSPDPDDWIGKRFGRLTVLHYLYKRRGSQYWLCRCDCGKEIALPHNLLLEGKAVSCGCLQRMITRTPLLLIEQKDPEKKQEQRTVVAEPHKGIRSRGHGRIPEPEIEKNPPEKERTQELGVHSHQFVTGSAAGY